ncbi:MAG: hypothetical protein ACQEST_04920 [Bacteroidota bacterium]
MKYAKILLPLIAISLLVTNCNDLQSVTGNDIQIEGEVTYMNIEGGFWAIKGDDETYDPTNLPKEFQQEGLQVTVDAEIEEDKLSSRMVGPIIKIISISER